MQTIAAQITKWLILNGNVQKAKSEIIQYGFEITLSTLCTMLSTVILSLTFFHKGDALVFVIFFVGVRLFIGGFHASTYFRCYVCSLAIFSAVSYEAIIIPLKNFGLKIFILLICSVYMYKSTPHVHENHRVSDDIIGINKSRLKKVIVINLIVMSAMHLISVHYSTMAVYSAIAATILLYIPEHGIEVKNIINNGGKK